MRAVSDLGEGHGWASPTSRTQSPITQMERDPRQCHSPRPARLRNDERGGDPVAGEIIRLGAHRWGSREIISLSGEPVERTERPTLVGGSFPRSDLTKATSHSGPPTNHLGTTANRRHACVIFIRLHLLVSPTSHFTIPTAMSRPSLNWLEINALREGVIRSFSAGHRA
jgi:hypothetical protein